MLFAVAVAGVPGPIINALLTELRTRFKANYVFRGAGAPLRASGMTLYDQKVVDQAVRMTADAAFTDRTTSPRGFCRNSQGTCALHDQKGTCGKTEEHTCALERPDYLIVLYQEGDSEPLLRSALHHSSYMVQLPRDVYNRLHATKDASIDAIKTVREKIGTIRRHLSSSMSPLYLPPNNFRSSALNKMLSSMAEDARAIESFRRANFSRERQGYTGRSQMNFSPADVEGRHGSSDLKPDHLALSRAYRLGCLYENSWHYDVSTRSQDDFGGKIPFSCREKGVTHPRGRHVNLTIDDCVK